jgi:hypothetical protein
LRKGWLAFQSGGETRRLAPIPKDWEARSDAELEDLVAQARIIAKRESAVGHYFGVG